MHQAIGEQPEFQEHEIVGGSTSATAMDLANFCRPLGHK